MEYLLLTAAVVFAAGQNVAKKSYQHKTERSTMFFFPLVASLTALLLFVLLSKFQLCFTLDLLPYSIGFAVSYACALCGSVLAMKYGSMAITLLASSYSLVIPTLYGVTVLRETMDALMIVGFVALLISLFLIRKPARHEKLDGKFFLCLVLSFFGNGFCSVVQKMQQIASAGKQKSEFMILSLGLCVLFLLIGVLAKKEKPLSPRTEWPFGILCGACNGLMNYSVLVLTGLLPNVILYPSISAGGVVVGFLIATLGYKERLCTRQYAGYAMGLISILLLSVF